MCVRKSGVCIGSQVAPLLCDIFLAMCGRAIQKVLKDTRIAGIFRYVDDFLILSTTKINEKEDGCLNTTMTLFQQSCLGLNFTYETPVDDSIRFLDLALTFKTGHVCWKYQARSGKAFLPFESEHSKNVKQAVAISALTASLKKSCPHQVQQSFDTQMSRLHNAGYPKPMMASICEKICRTIKTNKATSQQTKKPRPPFVVIPYIHGVTHKLKKIANRQNVQVICSAPNKAYSMCRKINQVPINTKEKCNTRHRTQYAPCEKEVIYHIPLTCGRFYIGQTGRCINDRAREHAANLRNLAGPGHLAAHCRTCLCTAELDNLHIMGHHRNRVAREVLEALAIDEGDDKCVSIPSLTLQAKEKLFLHGTLRG